MFGWNGNNFVKTMLRLAETKTEVSVVYDQVGSPTYTVDLASLLCDMIVTDKYGIYHATNEGTCSWAEFAQEIFWLAEKNVRVNPIPASQYPAKAVRPMNSRMSKNKLDAMGFARLPQDALHRYLRATQGSV
jgi:dTDP-4-dehydrorhamnose reductase